MLEYVAHAEHDDRVADDENSIPAVFARDHLGGAAQSEDDVAPAFSAWWPVIELAEEASELGLFRENVLDSDGGEAVEDSKLLLAKPLVNNERIRILAHSSGLDDESGRMTRAQIRRSEDDVRPILSRDGAEPVSEGYRLALAEVGQRHIDVADVQVDFLFAGLVRRLARDISR